MMDPLAPPHSGHVGMSLWKVPESCQARRTRIGLQFILSTKLQSSFFNAFSWPVWSSPSPFLRPRKSRSRTRVAPPLTSSSAPASSFSSGMQIWLASASNVFKLRALANSSISASEKGMALPRPLGRPSSWRVKARSRGIGPVLMQVPHPVPALVHLLISWNESAPSAMAFLITAFDTLWQLQTKSSGPRSVPSPPSSTFGVPPARTSSAVNPPKSGRLEMALSLAKSWLSPTRTPPSSFLPSGVKTSFLYVALASSL
mmetsp:Transcript_38648/g.115439  ORF Transcript_38648/g.115439 Transcript_38648/m.115439 type:complete len:258 (+) Transcript_38648:824-1597(+)